MFCEEPFIGNLERSHRMDSKGFTSPSKNQVIGSANLFSDKLQGGGLSWRRLAIPLGMRDQRQVTEADSVIVDTIGWLRRGSRQKKRTSGADEIAFSWARGSCDGR